MTPGSMVGRAAELGALVRAWSGVAATPGAAVRPAVITGAAGTGKSLLVSTALGRFVPAPRLVLSGTARVHEPAPYDWLAAVLSGRDTDAVPVPPDALRWLAQHPDTPRERYAPGALLRLAVRVVRALVGSGPGVLIVEDLHALDPASLNLVGELAVAPDLPVLLMVTSQPPDAAVSPPVVARTLARLAGVPGAVRQHLGPLGHADVAELLTLFYRRPVPPAVVDVVRQRTAGNPYLMGELLVASGAGPDALADAPLPGHLGGGPAAPVAEPATELTAREVEVLSYLAAGLPNKQIARSLGISVRTVTVHVSNVLRKTGSASRTEAALWAVQHELVRPGRP
jgi:DNA-binding CsgD family transcriptional regulator